MFDRDDFDCSGHKHRRLICLFGRAECDVSYDCEHAVGGGVGDCEARDGRGEEERESAFCRRIGLM